MKGCIDKRLPHYWADFVRLRYYSFCALSGGLNRGIYTQRMTVDFVNFQHRKLTAIRTKQSIFYIVAVATAPKGRRTAVPPLGTLGICVLRYSTTYIHVGASDAQLSEHINHHFE